MEYLFLVMGIKAAVTHLKIPPPTEPALKRERFHLRLGGFNCGENMIQATSGAVGVCGCVYEAFWSAGPWLMNDALWQTAHAW